MTKVKAKTYTTSRRQSTTYKRTTASTSRVQKRPARRYENVSSEDPQEGESEDESEYEQQDCVRVSQN